MTWCLEAGWWTVSPPPPPPPPPSPRSLGSLGHACSPSHAKSKFCHSRDFPPPHAFPRGERAGEGKWKSGGCLDSVKQNARQVNTHSCQLMQRCVWVLSFFFMRVTLLQFYLENRFILKICRKMNTYSTSYFCINNVWSLYCLKHLF